MRRASVISAVLVLLVAAGSAACGAEAPPPRPPTPAPSAVAAPPAPPPDLGEVPAPPGLVASGRLSKPSATLATARGWAKLPMPQSEQITELLTTEAVGPVVDIDQPIDFAVVARGGGALIKFDRAVSAAVKDPDKVKAALLERFKLVPGDNGVLVIQGLGRGPHDDGDEDSDGRPDAAGEGRTCELAPAFGDAPVRLVCGWSARALAELGPWLTRGATRVPTRADLQIDLRMEPLEPTIHKNKRLVALMFGRVVAERIGMASAQDLLQAFGTDVTDFATDLSGASFDVTLADAGVQVKMAMQLAGSTSEIARLATSHPERNGPAPAAFWQLPGDAEVAWFSRGVDDAELAKGRELVLPLVAEALADEGVKPADAKPLLDALGKLVSPAPMVFGSGFDPSAGRRGSWWIAEEDEPTTRVLGALKSLSAGLASPSIAAAYRSKHRDVLPPGLRALPAPKGLPPGAVHYELEIHAPQATAIGGATPAGKPPNRKLLPPPAKAPQLHVIVVPDGQRTWLAFGRDEGVVAARLAVALGSTGDKLAARADLAPFKDGAVGAGGFIRPRVIARTALQAALLVGAVPRGAEGVDPAALLPHQGLAPILFSSTTAAGATPATVEARLQLPRDAIEDIVAAVLRQGGF